MRIKGKLLIISWQMTASARYGPSIHILLYVYNHNAVLLVWLIVNQEK
jgi:hypothetical protein